MSAHKFFATMADPAADISIKDPGTGTALPNSKCGIVDIVTGASGETNTLAAPSKPGLFFGANLMTDGGGNRVITVAAAIDGTNSVITMNDAGDSFMLWSVKTSTTACAWRLVYNVGCSLS